MAIIWSVHKFRIATNCLLQYFYHYGEPRLPIPTSGSMAFGTFLHRKFERFFKENPGFQPRGTEAFYAPTNIPRNKSAEAFTATCKNHWRFAILKDLKDAKRINWRNKEEPFWYLKYLGELAPAVYNRAIQEGSPLLTEVHFDGIRLRHDDHYHYFTGRIDEVRRRGSELVVRDHKSGKEDHHKGLEYNVQGTVYTLALIHQLGNSERLAEYCGVEPKEARKWVGEEMSQIEKLTFEIHQIRTGSILPTRRSSQHALDFFNRLDELEARIELGQFKDERGSSECERCPFYERCSSDYENKIQYHHQRLLFHEFSMVPMVQKTKYRQRRLKFS